MPKTQSQMEKIILRYQQLVAELSEANQRLQAKLGPIQLAHAREVAPLQEEIQELRDTILRESFPIVSEGTSKFEFKTITIKAVVKVDRKVDETVLESADFLKSMRAVSLDPDELIRWKPSLDIRAYRKITPRQRKFFDQALVIGDPVSTLEIEGRL